MTILGLDIGDKRIGIAVSDPSEKIALPVYVLHRQNMEFDLNEIQKYIDQYNVRLIVCGLPRSLDGQIKRQAEKVISFIDNLKSKISIPVEFWNEWMTTKDAESVLISANIKNQKRKKVIDKLAATLILEGYLRRNLNQTISSPDKDLEH